jgi:hypothetical protein
VPADAERRWREIITGVRNRYDGTLFWALPADDRIKPPPFIEDLDHVYLLWSLPLTADAEYSEEQLRKTAANYLDDEVFLLDISLEMPITIAAAHPSAEGALQGCIPDSAEGDQSACLNPIMLEPPHPDNPAVLPDLPGQSAAYSALLQEINARDWLDGFVSRGFYTPAQLQDKSSSLHGKPAQYTLLNWFQKIIPAPAGE